MAKDPESVVYRLSTMRDQLSKLSAEEATAFLNQRFSSDELDVMKRVSEEVSQFMSQGFLHDEA
jgi:hypothetical protein